MIEHLTEQELIDYAYDLAPEPALQAARRHLAQCESCRGKLDALKRKFATLDLVRDEIKPSAELIERAAQVAAVPAGGVLAVPRYTFWLSGLAAAIVIGCTLLLISNNNAPQQTAMDRLVFDVAQPPSAGITAEGGGATSTNAAGSPASAPALAMGLRGRGNGSAEVASTARPAALAPSMADASVGQAVEPPPFAPASAIELVVLPKRENVQLTIYNSADLTLVREKRNLTLKQGWNWLQFMWANTLIDPTSLELAPLEQKDRVQVQQLVFPPRLKELGRWLIHSDVSGQVPFELTYFTSGLAWRAFYMGTLAQDEKTMRLEGYVRVDNRSGEEYQDAQTRLIVGQIHLLDPVAYLARREHAYGSPESGESDRLFRQIQKDKKYPEGWSLDENVVRSVLSNREIQKEGLSEYFLYTIEGTETIPDQWGKRLLSFKTDDIPVKNLYKYDEERYGQEAFRFLSFKNDTEHKLGTTPIPDGMIRIYGQADEQKHLSYVGDTGTKYIPVGEEVELDLGPARLVKVEPTLMEESTANYAFDSHSNVVGWDEIQTWKIEVTNTSTLPVDIEVTRGFDEPSWTLTSTGDGVAYEKYDVTHARFKLSIEPRSKKTFGYTVTQYRGTRSEYYNKTVQEKRP